jgi:hypothetical protein
MSTPARSRLHPAFTGLPGRSASPSSTHPSRGPSCQPISEQTKNNFLDPGGIRGSIPFISRSRGAGVFCMTEETSSPSQRAEARALTKERRMKGFERREAIFGLFVSGFSHQQIAKAPPRHRYGRRRAAARRTSASRQVAAAGAGPFGREKGARKRFFDRDRAQPLEKAHFAEGNGRKRKLLEGVFRP